MDLTHAEFLRVLRYDPATGIFTCLTRRGNRRPGDVAGTVKAGSKRSKPYRYIHVCGRQYTATHLAFFYMTGRWPAAEIDHEDRDTLNDRWSNLREATRTQNEWNKTAYRNSQTGFKGVSPIGGREGKYRADIMRNGERVYLGEFDAPEEAAAAYRVASMAVDTKFSVSQ